MLIPSLPFRKSWFPALQMQRVVKVTEILNIVREGIGMRSGRGCAEGSSTYPLGEDFHMKGKGMLIKKLKLKP